MNCLKNLFLSFLILTLSLLGGCKSNPLNEPGKKPILIHFYSKSNPVTLSYKETGFDKYTDIQMHETEKNWWEAKITCSGAIQFKFLDSNRNSYNLGGTMGNYPQDPAEDFRSSSENIWIKNGLIFNYNPDFKRPDGQIAVLTLNMHTYQETEQDKKFQTIADAINELKADVVVLQECAQKRDSVIVENHYGKTIRSDNMALILVNMLQTKFNEKYYYYWDFSHYGFDIYEEGTAILSKYKLSEENSNYISHSQDKAFWKSRKVTMIQTQIPSIGKINVFSAHMGWWDDKEEPFKFMFDNLNNWIQKDSKTADASFVCGDFNVEAGSKGYQYIMSSEKYIDVYYQANQPGFLDPTIGGKIDGWKEGNADGKRIDFMFLLKGSNLSINLAQRIFTEKSFGRVSDHCGVYFYLSSTSKTK